MTLAAALPPDHPDRHQLAEEVHARPPEELSTPVRATLVALLVETAQRAQEQRHIAELCRRFDATAPDPHINHFTADFGDVRLTWERHGEFSSYTFFRAGLSPTPFSDPPIAHMPADWIAQLPGRTIFAAHAKIVRDGGREPDAEFLNAHFDGNIVVGANVGHDAGMAFADFRLHADGFSRFLLVNRSFTTRQCGRMLQRLFEIETYRMLAMLALPIARDQARRITDIEQALTRLTDDIAHQNVADETLLQQLTHLAAEVESCLAASQFRFSACRAYSDLVARRVAELRETRLPGLQTIEEFMARRFAPAVATCLSTSRRLHDLSERVGQVSALLSTRVDIAREKQNQMLLGSMNRRASLQLRLQQTVEVISVIPITYYVVTLVGYLAKALAHRGVPLDVELTEGIAVPIAGALVIWGVKRAHNRIEAGLKGKQDPLEH
jgi:uncharacterized membrane-anchored protein